MEFLTIMTFIGIALCVVQSGIFSGLNLALFGISAMRLATLSGAGNRDAERLLALRRDSNFLLATVLWGNVGTNVLLTLLSDSVLTGAIAFVFSTFVITLGGEILPQAYFSRNALRMATRMRPILRFWQLVLFPIAKPTGLFLDAWLGRESIGFLAEIELREMLRRHVASPRTEIGWVEGVGALNFMALDDLSVLEEGETLDPASVIEVPEMNGRPVFPKFGASPDDPFLRRVEDSGRKWVVVTSPDGDPLCVLDADAFLRAVLFRGEAVRVEGFCHHPILIHDAATKLDAVLPRLRIEREHAGDDVIDEDLILVWGAKRRVITGADILGRLLRGIARPHPAPTTPSAAGSA